MEMGPEYEHLEELVRGSLPHFVTIFHQFAFMVSSVIHFEVLVLFPIYIGPF